jgi:hypothetical protein
MPAAKRNRSLRILRVRIFDVRGFIENHACKFHSAKLVNVPAQNRITRQDNIAFRNPVKEGVAGRSFNAQKLQFRHKFIHLPGPIEN